MTSGRAPRLGAGSTAGAAGDTALSGEGAEAFSSGMVLMRTGHGYSSVNLSDLSAPKRRAGGRPPALFVTLQSILQRACVAGGAAACFCGVEAMTFPSNRSSA